MNFKKNLIICLAFGLFFTNCEQRLITKKSKFTKKANPADFYSPGHLKALPHGAFLLFINKLVYDAKDTTECGFLLKNSRIDVLLDKKGNILGSEGKNNNWSTEKVYHNYQYYSLIGGNDPQIITYDTNLAELSTKKLDSSLLYKSDYFSTKLIPIDSNTLIAYNLPIFEIKKDTKICKEYFYRINLKTGITKVVIQDEEYNYFQQQFCFLNWKKEIISILFRGDYFTGTEIIVNKYNLEFEKLATQKFKSTEYNYHFYPILLADNETIMAVSGTKSNNFVFTKITDDMKISQAISTKKIAINNIPNNQQKLYFAETDSLDKKLIIYELIPDFNFNKVAVLNEIFFPNYINKTEKGLAFYNLNYLNNDFMPIIEFSSIDEAGNRINKRLFESNIKINCPLMVK